MTDLKAHEIYIESLQAELVPLAAASDKLSAEAHTKYTEMCAAREAYHSLVKQQEALTPKLQSLRKMIALVQDRHRHD